MIHEVDRKEGQNETVVTYLFQPDVLMIYEQVECTVRLQAVFGGSRIFKSLELQPTNPTAMMASSIRFEPGQDWENYDYNDTGNKVFEVSRKFTGSAMLRFAGNPGEPFLVICRFVRGR